MIRFVAVGDVLLDVTASGRGHDSTIDVRPGGSAVNSALAARALGAEASVVGRAGDDAPGRLLRAELARAGITPRLQVDRTLPTGTFLLADGELRVDRGANLGFSLAEELEADAILVSGYLPQPDETLARCRAPWVVLDAANRHDIPSAVSVIANHGNVHELAKGRRLACVTRGAAGAIAILDGVEVAARPDTAVPIDALGAGDAFAAGLLVSLARGATLHDALAEACRCGALAALARQ